MISCACCFIAIIIIIIVSSSSSSCSSSRARAVSAHTSLELYSDLWVGIALNVKYTKASVRIDLFRFADFVKEQHGLAIVFSGSMRFGLRFLNASWFGPLPLPLPLPRFRPVLKLSASIRLVRSVCYSCLIV